jgi:hypothetical protein
MLVRARIVEVVETLTPARSLDVRGGRREEMSS